MHFLGTFESGNTAQFTSATGSAQSTTKKEDSYGGVSLNGTSFVKNINTDYGDSAKTKVWIGAWFRWTSNPSGNWYLIKADGEVYRQFSLGINSQQLYIEVADNSAVAGTATLVANTWYFIQVESYVHASAGYAKVYIDGVLDIDTGLVDSLRGTDTGIRRAEWIGSEHASISCYLDNCLFTDVNPDWGIKVSKAGKDSSSMDSKNLDWRSDFTFLKFHGEYTTSTTFNPGDQTKTVSITHGLGYIPAFMAYGVRSDDSSTFIIPSLPYGISEFDFAEAWADTDKIYFKYSIFDQYVGAGWNQIIQPLWTVYNNSGVNNARIGWSLGSSDDFGVQYAGVYLPNSASISSASLEFYVSEKGSGTSDVKMNIWGIDVDSLADFGTDLGQAKTTATHSQTQSNLSVGSTFGITVTNEIQEIVNRAGWSSGNNLGFYIFDNATSTADNNYFSTYPDNDLNLNVLISGTLTVNFRVIVFKDKVY